MHRPVVSRRAVRGRALAAVLLASLLLVPGGGQRIAATQAASPPGKLVIHLTVSGALRYAGALSGAVVNDTFYSNFCEVRRKSRTYIVYFANQATGPDSFRLMISGYKPSVTRYDNPRQVSLEAGVARLQHDLNGQGIVLLSSTGLTGTVTSEHLQATPPLHAPVKVQASWSCPRLFVAPKK